jgi:hypothetical protein
MRWQIIVCCVAMAKVIGGSVLQLLGVAASVWCCCWWCGGSKFGCIINN